MNQTTSILNQKLTIPENIIAQELTGEIVMLDMESESYYSLNSVASRIWQLLTSLENVEASIQQLLQVYLVDEPTLSGDVTLIAQELVAEELLIGCDNEAEEFKKSNQPEAENAQKVDNRIPYEKPLLRKHGKINQETNITFTNTPTIDGFGAPGYADFS
ncbi:PqqD family protein [Calothrix sp. CCY 0018]|uniref:PqqD family protein n=1 Tax=Calothrix sp. CCY 0018 TaxID=3103864 RepID=UPI0039C76119